ncbi:hypothetical protein AVEN_77103-1 [Araneus ventricosus]|uniref:Uncharacterized protein n=1 Tax=Araneus ventricosus TaxID=182803 RepID=A0A4Y2M3B4_ARAVE|nr:hypothetical protein AVEN_77103-1 [Araneus ventricosus]
MRSLASYLFVGTSPLRWRSLVAKRRNFVKREEKFPTSGMIWFKEWLDIQLGRKHGTVTVEKTKEWEVHVPGFPFCREMCARGRKFCQREFPGALRDARIYKY